MQKTVLFIFPPPDNFKETRFGIPLGILYLSSQLKRNGYNVKLLDLNVEEYSLETLTKSLFDVDIVGISIPSYCLNNALRIIKELRQLKSDMPIATGGPDCILFPRLVEGADVTFVGEGEDIIAEVFDNLLEGQDLSNCSGIIYKKHGGETCEGRFLQVNCNLDAIAFPDRSILSEHVEFGKTVIRSSKLPKSTQIITSRGCPMHCRFCARHALSYTTYRERSVENVLQEIKQIAEQGYKMLWISDDNFAANIPRAIEILDGIIKMKLNISMAFSGWVKAANEELYKKAKDAGVRIISFGLESGTQEVLDFYNKKITLDQSRYAVELADSVGLYTVGNFIFGAPIENEEHIKKTLQFAKELPLDTVNFKILGYMAGSDLWYEYVNSGIINKDERNVFADKKRGLSNFTLDELKEIVKNACDEFRNNKEREKRLKTKIAKYGLPYEIYS